MIAASAGGSDAAEGGRCACNSSPSRSRTYTSARNRSLVFNLIHIFYRWRGERGRGGERNSVRHVRAKIKLRSDKKRREREERRNSISDIARMSGILVDLIKFCNFASIRRVKCSVCVNGARTRALPRRAPAPHPRAIQF